MWERKKHSKVTEKGEKKRQIEWEESGLETEKFMES